MKTALIGIALLATGCVSPEADGDLGERIAMSELDAASDSTGLAPSSTVSLERERYRWQAEDWTAGRVEQVGPDFVVIRPYIGGVEPVRMELEDQTAIFRGNEAVSLRWLVPGTDVRANYVDRRAAQPHIISLEVLTPSQVQRLSQP
jgi:hypothetical protein